VVEDARRDIGKDAVSYFNEGFNCAESVAKALCEALMLGGRNAVKSATPFGGGIAGKGYLCGAVSGAMIALGLSKGRVSSKEDRSPCNKVAQRFVQDFLNEFSSVSCRDIIGVDLNSAEGRKKHKDHLRNEKCCPVVRFAAERMHDLIKSSS
jgi:C_GCAxxG_C_C family probable redox protein